MGRKANRKTKTKVSSLLVVFAILILCAGIYFIYNAFNPNKTNEKPKTDEIKVYTEEELKAIEEAKKEYKIKITAGGDLLIHNTVFDSVKKSDGTYDFKPIFKDVKYLFEDSDLSILNLEVPVAGNIYKPSNYPMFNSPVELLDAVKDMGVDVVSTANNHALDKRLAGLKETIKNATAKGIEVVGTNDTDDTSPLIIEKNNIKIGIAAYTYGTNGIPIPDEAPNCVNLIDKEKMKQAIEYMEKEGVEVKIFVMHFGQEYQLTPNDTQKDLVKFLSDYGVDIIFGSHPHVPQPYVKRQITTLKGEKKDQFVIYSMGNFVSGQIDYYTKLAGVATVNITKKAGKISIDETEVTPIYTYLKYVNGKRTFKVVPLEKSIKDYESGVSAYSSTEYTNFKKYYSDTKGVYEKGI